MSNCTASFFKGRFYLTETQNLFVGILLVLMSLPVLLINLFLAFAFVKTRQLTNSTNIYIMLLSVSDCMQGAVSMPTEAAMFILHHEQTNCILTSIIQVFSLTNTKLSGLLIVLIAFDRYMNIRSEFTEDNCCLNKLKSKLGSVILVFLCLILSLAHGGSSILGNSKRKRILGICMGITDFICILTVYVLYIKMYVKVRHHYKKSIIYRYKNGTVPRYVRELAKTVLLILISVTVCYSPFVITHIYISNYTKNNISITLQFTFYLFRIAIFFNAILSACIILYRNEEVRVYVANEILSLRRTNTEVPVTQEQMTHTSSKDVYGTLGSGFKQSA